MTTRIQRSAIVSAAALLLTVGAVSVAVADDQPDPSASPTAAASTAPDDGLNTEPPATPEETDLADVPPEGNGMPDSTEDPDMNHPGYTDCGPIEHVYVPTSKGASYHAGVGPTQADTNGTSRTAHYSFTSETSGTVGVSVSAGLQVSVSAMLAKIDVKYDITLSSSLTVRVGNTVSGDIPPGRTVNERYGVYRLKNTGQSYIIPSNCTITSQKTVTSYSPMKVGWYLWES
jgi:hypothetical protein